MLRGQGEEKRRLLTILLRFVTIVRRKNSKAEISGVFNFEIKRAYQFFSTIFNLYLFRCIQSIKLTPSPPFLSVFTSLRIHRVVALSRKKKERKKEGDR